MKPIPTVERRLVATAELRVKATADGADLVTLGGYALKYGTMSEDLGGFKETLQRGAFAESLKTADVRALIDHDPGKLLGRNKSGTLRLVDDEVGLGFEVDVDPRQSYVADLMISMERGDKDQCSFGFYCDECDWELYPGDPTLILRTIISGRIFDVSIVTFPAYTDTEAAIRSLDLARPELGAIARRSREATPSKLTTPPATPARAARSGTSVALLRRQLDMVSPAR